MMQQAAPYYDCTIAVQDTAIRSHSSGAQKWFTCALGAAVGAAVGLVALSVAQDVPAQTSLPVQLFSRAAIATPTPKALMSSQSLRSPLSGAIPDYATSALSSAAAAVPGGMPTELRGSATEAHTRSPVAGLSLAVMSVVAFGLGLLSRRRTFQQVQPPPQSLAEIALMAWTSEHNYDYDLVVIGAGSGGVRASRIAASHGAKVALLEPSMSHGPPNYSAVGGTCVNVGCVPKKLMVYGSHYSHDMQDAKSYGWNVPDGITLDWSTLMANKDKEISRLNGIYKNMLVNAGVELIEGWGSLQDEHTVAIKQDRGAAEPDKTISAYKILVAVGGWPFIPDIPGKDLCITSNEAFYLKECPKRIVIIGGGYIAVEFACIFKGYGADVTLMYRGDMFLRGFDDDIRDHLANEMKEMGIDVQFNTNPAKVEEAADGSFVVTTEAGAQVPCDKVMYATGRKPYIQNLGLEDVGVELNERDGAIKVDEYSKTNVDSIYAVGDVTNRINLTPVALLEGHCFADTEFGGMDRVPSHENVACAVFSQPPLGTVGMTEAEAAKKFPKVAIFKSGFRPMVHTMTGASTRVLMKLIVDVATDGVLGVHMCGPDAAEILQGMAVAVKMGATKKDFDSTVGIHPSAAEEFVTMRSPSYFLVDGEKVDKLP